LSRGVRLWVFGLLALLCVPAIIGFDVWPLTGWRLFSLSRDATQNEWALDAETGDGIVRVDLEQLPLAFRNAAWPLDHSLHASKRRRGEICFALFEGVRDAVPDAAGLTIVRLHRHMTDAGIEDTEETWTRCGWSTYPPS
jgi:hypothetical protein